MLASMRKQCSKVPARRNITTRNQCSHKNVCTCTMYAQVLIRSRQMRDAFRQSKMSYAFIIDSSLISIIQQLYSPHHEKKSVQNARPAPPFIDITATTCCVGELLPMSCRPWALQHLNARHHLSQRESGRGQLTNREALGRPLSARVCLDARRVRNGIVSQRS